MHLPIALIDIIKANNVSHTEPSKQFISLIPARASLFLASRSGWPFPMRYKKQIVPF
jgi:hypothetical protein